MITSVVKHKMAVFKGQAVVKQGGGEHSFPDTVKPVQNDHQGDCDHVVAMDR